ncbi:MAG: hypothetical protein M3252_02490 [Actinomycetota bacterium]|nr:hypothetical protein [Actinomycetota bacterium]
MTAAAVFSETQRAPRHLSRERFNAAIAGEFELVTTQPLLDELVRVLRYPKRERITTNTL